MSLKDLIADVNVNEICEHIETETLSEWVNAWQEAALSALRPVSREAWEPCKICNGKTTLYQYTANTKLFMNTFGHAATLVTECMGCPPYAECCMKGISTNSAFKINLCPECGRPLTEEAWAELERRLIK